MTARLGRGARGLYMDVRFLLGAPLCLLLASACNVPAKTEETVFPLSTVDCGPSAIQGQYVARWVDGHTTIETAKDREELLEKFVRPNLFQLELVEQDQPVSAPATSISSGTAPINWGVDAIQANAAWTQGYRGQGITVAVADTGVDINHPQLKSQIYTNPVEANGFTGVDDDNNGYIDDIHGWNFKTNTPVQNDEVGHGTHIAGIIAANPNDGIVKGVAPDAKILPVQFMGPKGGTAGNAILAFQYAVKMGARVINASFTSTQCSQNMQSAMLSYEAQNVLFASAAGNSYNNLSVSPEFPAALSLPLQITVGASSIEFMRPSFSNYGPLVQVVAPGQDIYSTFKNGGYAYLDGTSMATPFVAGELAVLMSARPKANANVIRDALFNNVAHGNFSVLYNGEIRVSAALSALLNSTLP